MLGIAYVDSPVGCLRIKADEHALLELEFVDAAGEDTEHSPIIDQTLAQLCEYFEGKRREFDLPLAPLGTPFQKSVWDQLVKIPLGKTTSYSALAKHLNNVGAIRAVGGANHVNPIAIIIPCHRVIGADRTLVGYGGGLWRKRWLLEHERQVKEGTRTVLLTQYF